MARAHVSRSGSNLNDGLPAWALPCTHTPGDVRQPHRDGPRLSMRRYLEAASGSIPLLLIASVARGEARNSINRFEAALSFESATTAAAKTWIN